MPPRDLIARTELFSLAVLKFCRGLPKTDEAREAAGQLRRSANSVRANYRAARKGRSRAEFESKLGTVWEEADECVGWLTYLRDGEITTALAMMCWGNFDAQAPYLLSTFYFSTFHFHGSLIPATQTDSIVRVARISFVGSSV